MRLYPLVIVIICSLLCLTAFNSNTDVFVGKNGTVSFESNAPLEIIKANSNKLSGVIDTKSKSFSFTIPMNTFEGFNNPLQRIHFNENYVESEKYPQATFKGKIIEDIDFNAKSKHEVRAKGKLLIHGVEVDRIIRATLETKGNTIAIDSKFTVPLTDHDIKIPSIVNKKIAEEVEVSIKLECAKK